MKNNDKHKKRIKRSLKRRLRHNQRRNIGANNPVAKNLQSSLDYLLTAYGSDATEKDKVHSEWVEKRAAEIQKTYGDEDSFLFLNASIAVSEMERLYDTIEIAVREHFPTINIDDLFKTIKMYLGKNVSGVYTYLTDWKTLMFTIQGNILEPGTFPTLGFHYDLIVDSHGLLGLQTKQGNVIAIIPVVPGAEKTEESIYPQHGEPLENGNLEYAWEKWYELNKLIGCEKTWFKSMKYFDEILEYTFSKDLFNRKKIIAA